MLSGKARILSVLAGTALLNTTVFVDSGFGAALFTGDSASGLTVTVDQPVFFTADQSIASLGLALLGFQDVYSSVQPPDFQAVGPQSLTLSLNGGPAVAATSFVHANDVGEASLVDFFIGFDFGGVSVNVGDQLVLSVGDATSNPGFDIPDAVPDFIELDIFNNIDGLTFTSGARVASSSSDPNPVPEPASLLGLAALAGIGFATRRKLTETV